MDIGGFGWAVQTIVGVLIFAAVLFWAMTRNKASKEDIDETEQATKELYRAEDAERDRANDTVP